MLKGSDEECYVKFINFLKFVKIKTLLASPTNIFINNNMICKATKLTYIQNLKTQIIKKKENNMYIRSRSEIVTLFRTM